MMPNFLDWATLGYKSLEPHSLRRTKGGTGQYSVSKVGCGAHISDRNWASAKQVWDPVPCKPVSYV